MSNRAWSQASPFNPSAQQYVTVNENATTVTFDAVLSASFMRWSVPLGISGEYTGVTTAHSLADTSTFGNTTQYVGGPPLVHRAARGLERGALVHPTKPQPDWRASTHRRPAESLSGSWPPWSFVPCGSGLPRSHRRKKRRERRHARVVGSGRPGDEQRDTAHSVAACSNRIRIVVRLVRTDLRIHLDHFQRGCCPFHTLIGTSDIVLRNGPRSPWSTIDAA
jgi:hypothetical protein